MASRIHNSSISKNVRGNELLEGDIEHLKTVASLPNEDSPWIDPGILNLTHRIGRGPFGDVWIGKLHQFTREYDECHDVAVKMLNFITENQMQTFMTKFEKLFYKCQGMQGICCPHGITVKNGKVCIVMKLYESCIGDKMAQLKGDRLPLKDVLRWHVVFARNMDIFSGREMLVDRTLSKNITRQWYGADLAQGVLELHSQDILVLNLKPFNFLLDEQDRAIVGDFGIPMLLLGIPLRSSDMTLRLGTPSYMAPEQWGADVRGPVSYETDAWGFACSIVEMLTGFEPWYGKSTDDIFNSVVIKREKPGIPTGLPNAIINILSGCFEYDYRHRPSFADILFAFKNPNAILGNCGWVCIGDITEGKQNDVSRYTEKNKWLILKDRLEVGDLVRSNKGGGLNKSQGMANVEGTIVALDGDMHALVKAHGWQEPLKIHASNLERISAGFTAGDWVRLKGLNSGEKQSPLGVLHYISRDGKVKVAFLGLETFWIGNSSDLEKAESFVVGQFITIKSSIKSPRFQWPLKRNGWDTGKISWILPNGGLVVRFPGHLFKNVWSLADPAQVEVVRFEDCDGLVKKYHHLEAMHWAVRPAILTIGFFSVMKLGMLLVNIVPKQRKGKEKTSNQPRIWKNQLSRDGQTTGNAQNSHSPTWLPPAVANVLFRGVTTGQ